jgi:hypothetical protein
MPIRGPLSCFLSTQTCAHTARSSPVLRAQAHLDLPTLTPPHPHTHSLTCPNTVHAPALRHCPLPPVPSQVLMWCQSPLPPGAPGSVSAAGQCHQQQHAPTPSHLQVVAVVPSHTAAIDTWGPHTEASTPQGVTALQGRGAAVSRAAELVPTTAAHTPAPREGLRAQPTEKDTKQEASSFPQHCMP